MNCVVISLGKTVLNIIAPDPQSKLSFGTTVPLEHVSEIGPAFTRLFSFLLETLELG